MAFKIVSGVLAAAMLITFISPVVIKLKDVALSAVVLIGLTMMIIDLCHSLKSKAN